MKEQIIKIDADIIGIYNLRSIIGRDYQEKIY